MNPIRNSLENIQASEELKRNTLCYLNEQQAKRNRFRLHFAPGYALAVICLCLFMGTGGYSVYRKPVSYISVDVNPSIELNINRFGKVVSVEAYNEDGRTVTEQVPLKNVSYMQAIDRLLKDESYSRYLNKDAMLVFTVVSDQSEEIVKELNASELFQSYGALTYVSDSTCMHEAHQHDMSFGKYRTYLELLEYDESVTIEDCHGMTMGELRDRIDTCSHNGQTNKPNGQGDHHNSNNSHGGHHGH